jgi:hypothetical protein
MSKTIEIIEQIEFFDIPSPCKGVCQTNNRGYCIGCFRSRDERFNWNKFSDGQKKHIIKLCQQREKRIRQRHLEQQDSPIQADQTQLDL